MAFRPSRCSCIALPILYYLHSLLYTDISLNIPGGITETGQEDGQKGLIFFLYPLQGSMPLQLILDGSRDCQGAAAGEDFTFVGEQIQKLVELQCAAAPDAVLRERMSTWAALFPPPSFPHHPTILTISVLF
jgi:hypothetical protein